MDRVVRMDFPETLAVATVAVVEAMLRLPVAMVVCQEAAVAGRVPGLAGLAEKELEESAVYGPGSSEQCRTQRPGCAEA